MKSQLKISLSVGLIFLGVYGCSSSEESQVQKQETDTLYIFDEVPPEDIYKFESPEQQTYDVFVVQIGAFSTLERAKDFAQESRVILSRDIKVEFVQKKNLYVVWIHPPFENRMEAESYKNELSLREDFKDAWIVTIESKK